MLKIGPYQFKSRLLLGTGKFPDFDVQKEAVKVSGAEILTFAVRRMNIYEPNQPNFWKNLKLQILLCFLTQQEQKRRKKRLELRNWQRRPVYVI